MDRDEAEKRIGHLYPKAKLSDGTLATVIAWIWARTVTCPNPACGGTMPLVRSFWLGKKKGKERCIRPIPDGKHVRFEISGPSGAPRDGTVGRNGAECLLCGAAVPLAYIRAEGKAGRMGAQLMAIAAEGKRQRYYLRPNEEHEQAAGIARPDDIPESELPEQALGFRVQGYGVRTWADLFTNRQLAALTTTAVLIDEVPSRASRNARDAQLSDFDAYASAVVALIAMTMSRIADYNNAFCAWRSDPKNEGIGHLFARQSISMIWDFCEANPLSQSSGNMHDTATWVADVINAVPATCAGIAMQCDAARLSYANGLLATDPPYYDNVGYADLSDFFYVWLRHPLGKIFPELTRTLLTPKSDELVADPFRHGGNEEAERFFEEGFREVFSRVRADALDGYPISVFYAFKQSETGSGSYSARSDGSW